MSTPNKKSRMKTKSANSASLQNSGRKPLATPQRNMCRTNSSPMPPTMTSDCNRDAQAAFGAAPLLDLVGCGFRTILADPPWPFKGTGHGTRKKGYISKPPYPTMPIAEICALPVGKLAAEDCHLWLWTDNVNLHNGFHVMEAWGFKYLAPIHWIKPSGCGCWWIHRTQTILFGYKSKCRFPAARFKPNIFTSGGPKRHSEKPEKSYELIESVSQQPRLELFARQKRTNWQAWGNEV